MSHIESRPCKGKPDAKYDLHVECACTDEEKSKLEETLKAAGCIDVIVMPRYDEGKLFFFAILL